MVDSAAEVLRIASDRLDVKPICVHAADIETPKKAGVDKADVMIAVTPSDDDEPLLGKNLLSIVYSY
ncbi:MAG: NAD-binding protein [Holosporales bacterium]|nr:NAD-binding protein [Holosporales bacterium]